jgi:hypothetical protein
VGPGIATDRKELVGLLRGKQAVLVHRADLSALDTDGSVMAAFAAVPTRVVVAANTSPVTEKATHLLPAASFIEREGHWVNEDGRVQRVKRAYRARKGTREDLALLAVLGGGRLPAEAPHAVRGSRRDQPAFRGADLGIRRRARGGARSRGRSGGLMMLGHALLKAGIGFLFVLQMLPLMIYLERKGSAFIQDRLGPNACVHSRRRAPTRRRRAHVGGRGQAPHEGGLGP